MVNLKLMHWNTLIRPFETCLFLSLSLWSGKIVVIIIRLQTTKNLQRAVLLVKSFILYGAAVKALHCDFVVKKFSCWHWAGAGLTLGWGVGLPLTLHLYKSASCLFQTDYNLHYIEFPFNPSIILQTSLCSRLREFWRPTLEIAVLWLVQRLGRANLGFFMPCTENIDRFVVLTLVSLSF